MPGLSATQKMTKESINIQEADRHEVSLLSDLIRVSFRVVAERFNLTPENCPKHPSNCTDNWIRNDLRRGVKYYTIEFNGAKIGCVALEKATQELCYLERLAVLPKYRRNGFGKALVDHVFNQAKAMGANRIRIGVISDQVELKLWYQKMGFVEKETKEFSQLPFPVSFMAYEL